MPLPNGAVFAPGETDRIKRAVDALEKDPHAPRTMSVEVILHLHREYPKHVTVGKDKDGNAITKVAADAGEEAALLQAAAPAEPAAAQDPAAA
jgi:hypothetical protein